MPKINKLPQNPGKAPDFDALYIQLEWLQPNESNPRILKEPAFKKLVASIRDFPKMFATRPIVLDSRTRPVILGGNMRYQCLKAAGYTQIPNEWIVFADEMGFSEEEKRRFVVQDNLNAGEWDFEILANEFTAEELDSWGLYAPYEEPQEGEGPAGSPGGPVNETQVGDTYECFLGDDPAHRIGYVIKAPFPLPGTELAEDVNKTFKGLFGEIDKTLTRFAKNSRKAGVSFTIKKNGQDISTKFQA